VHAAVRVCREQRFEPLHVEVQRGGFIVHGDEHLCAQRVRELRRRFLR
jgi:hypothetical protein